ncbi:MAG: D-amino acid dehydrogenase [Rhodospirillaceae bacterium]
MKVAVLGSGVVGTSTAYFLAEDGHDVVVLDRQKGSALETSFANGGQISACHAKPWAAPNIPLQAFLWTFQKDAPLLFRPWRWDPALWSWGLKFLANCTSTRERINMDRTLRVALYSRKVLKALRQKTNIQYDQQLNGILHIYRTKPEFERGIRTGKQLASLGLPQDVLSADECVKVEPALVHAARNGEIAGGLMSCDDESGDARRFSDELAKLAAARGVRFKYGATVRRLEHKGNQVTRVITDQGDETPDAVVLSLGSYSPMLAKQLGLKLPVYPAKGYSITAEIENPDAAPTVSVTDETRFMVFTRLGNRLRVAGTAELAGWDTDLDPWRVEPLANNVKSLFPAASSYRELNAWCGLRPTTPDSVPILGPTRFENLFLNTGHGTLGWTMACGSGRVIADLIAGRTPEIDMVGLGLERFGR